MKTDKDLSYYKGLHFKMVVDYDAEEEVYVVRFPDLPGCIMHADAPEEAVRLGLQVKDEWLALAFSKGWAIPEPLVDLETTGRLTLRLPKSLHKKVIDRAEWEGVSQNQLILSFVTEGMGKKEAEDVLKKLYEKQDVMISLLKAARTSSLLSELVDTGSFKPNYIFDIEADYNARDLLCDVWTTCVAATTATATTTASAATIDSGYSHGLAIIDGVKEGFRAMKVKTVGAFKGTFQGGHANEA
jgi:antitoxin HicB